MEPSIVNSTSLTIAIQRELAVIASLLKAGADRYDERIVKGRARVTELALARMKAVP
ncbi:hypothetical protein KZ820_16435 [Sphingomonas sp. RRHST34]|uniref:Uncharacterized protein n=1 Tax=Sphingomonas citri TaxID=2862499 RepID=A0ABS7BRY1_9SPHN|nr:hypothetical protein [Sphingomonas citri]